ncbi:uncharacterized protein TNCV_2862581 [Trichonephila clavipes]|nr:uncharacterized protein TNCV_2862581 [Trichonephila clavipes]
MMNLSMSIAIVLTPTMGNLTYTENAGMHFLYGRTNGNGRSTLWMYPVQFPDRRMPDHRFFQRLHRQLRETLSFLFTKHDAGRRRAVRSPCLEESILNVVTNRPESSTRTSAHHVSVSHKTI